MCTPRNLVLLTRSTAAPSMVSGGCSVWLFLKSTTISFVLLTFSRRLLSLQKVDLLPVVGLIVLGDETHQSCVVRKLHHVIGAVGCCAVVSQQGEEQGTEHTALRGPCAECDAARDVVADSYCLGSLTEKVQYPIAKGGVEPQLVQFTDELLWDYGVKS